MSHRRQRGMSFAEVLMSVAIIGVLIYAVARVSSTGIMATKTNTDRQFAIQKAMSMLEELKSLVQVNNAGTITVLDNFNDALLFRDRLTTIGLLTDPADEGISGNIPHDPGKNRWVYSRQISVGPLADPNNVNLIISSTDVRLVRVRVYKNQYNSVGVLINRRLLAEVASVVRTLAVVFPTTQVYDVYCVAIENVPGWWVNMGSLVPFVQAAINDLENRHPGLEFRQRWITRLSYGRNSQYRPYINANIDSIQPIPWAYFYPGVLPGTYNLERGGALVSPPAQFYYPPANFGGMMQQEAVAGIPQLVNTVTAQNPFPYALADQYNHSMRYLDEFALFQQRVNATDAAGNPLYPNEQPTLRILLEDMYQRPNQYLNALFINLHGELLPFPPIRNYSDAAKKPDFYTAAATAASPHNGVRVVTHSENLAYDTTVNAAASVNLRVYSYMTNPLPVHNAVQVQEPDILNNAVNIPLNREFLNEPISVIIPGINWVPGNILGNTVSAIVGGVDLNPNLASGPTVVNIGAAPAPPAVSSPRDPYAFVLAAQGGEHVLAPATRQMYWTREFVAPAPGGPYPAGATVIKLWNTPIVQPCVPTPADCSINQLGAWAGGVVDGVAYAGNTDSGGVEHTSPVNTRRLYGMEYVPSPMENFAQAAVQTPFATNLATPGRMLKNTARWIIQIPANALPNDAPVQVDTMIGNYNVGTGVLDAMPQHPLAPYNEPEANFSRTYFWRGQTTWLYGPPGGAGSGGNLPITERYQIIGDPRHCPYADAKMPHLTNGGVWNPANVNTRFGMGFNRYWDDFENTGEGDKATAADLTEWQGWEYDDAAAGGPYGIKNENGAAATMDNDNWASTNGGIEVDVPRIYQIFRSGLMFSNSLYTTMTGWPYYYLGIGGEIGYDDANGFPDNVPVSNRPFNGVDGTYFEQSITPGRDWGDTGNPADPIGTSGPLRASVKYIQEANGSLAAPAPAAWWSMIWLGELYPDDRYSDRRGANLPNNDWREVGNLATPNATAGEAATLANRFRRIRRDNLVLNLVANMTHTPGTTFEHTARRTHEQGVPMFFWRNAANQTVDVTSVGGTLQGAIAAGGTEINTNFSFPLDPTIDANRPFETAQAGPATNGLGELVYSPFLNVTELREFYSNTANTPWHSSLLIALRDPTGVGSRALYTVENGLSPTGVAGTDFIARWSFLSLIQGFFEAGLFNGGADPAVTQLPRVRITDPNPNTNLTNPSNINVAWAIQYRRWDGRPYTNAYPAGFTEAATLSYFPMYSADNGQTWRYIRDDTAATPGVRILSTDPRFASVAVTAGTSVNWNVAALPAGAYIIRVEGYRDLFPLHYAFHQYQAFVVR